MLSRSPTRPQFFYTTTPLPCPYLPGRTERKIVTELAGPDGEALHDRLGLLPGRGACRFPDGVAALVRSALRAYGGHLVAHGAGRCRW